MQKGLGFLKISSVAVKTAAWIFLFLGIMGGISIILGNSAFAPRWMGAVIIIVYVFAFFLLYLISRMADLLSQLIAKQEEKEP